MQMIGVMTCGHYEKVSLVQNRRRKGIRMNGLKLAESLEIYYAQLEGAARPESGAVAQGNQAS